MGVHRAIAFGSCCCQVTEKLYALSSKREFPAGVQESHDGAITADLTELFSILTESLTGCMEYGFSIVIN
jgi:hypothetical protein